MQHPASTNTGHLLHNLLLFGRVLRELGLDVHAGRMLDVIRALEYVDVGRKRDFYVTLLSLLVHRQRDLPLFDEAFRVFWRRPVDRLTTMDLRSLGEQRRYRQPQVGPPLGGDSSAETDSRGVQDMDEVELTQTYSPQEVLREKDFAKFSPREVSQAKAMMVEMAWDLGRRRSRRWEPGRGPTLDLRRTLRRNLKYGGEPLDLARRQVRDKPRPLVLICDVSGSMERYTRMLLHFIHCVTRDLERVETFLFATRLTRITHYLEHRDIDRAVTEVARVVPDWAGGTRIGEAIRNFNFHWARRILGRGAVVLLISDGWDRGEPDLLHREMVRLQRSCRRLIWLNPLLGSADYHPLTRGMQAALPFVDDFLPVHNLSSLEDLASHLNTLSTQRPARRQQVEVAAPAAPQPSPTSPSASPRPQTNPTFRHPLWGRG